MIMRLALMLMLLGSVAWGQTSVLKQALAYPDAVVVKPLYGKVIYQLRVNAADVATPSGGFLDAKLLARMDFTMSAGGMDVQKFVDGSITWRHKTNTWAALLRRNTIDHLAMEEGGVATGVVSPKMGLVSGFELATHMQIEGVAAHIVMSNPTTAEAHDQEVSVSGRIPHHGVVDGTPFARAWRQVEESGMEAGHALDTFDGGSIEALWAGGRTQGMYTVPVLMYVISCLPDGFNTEAAYNVLGTEGAFVPAQFTMQWTLAQGK